VAETNAVSPWGPRTPEEAAALPPTPLTPVGMPAATPANSRLSGWAWGAVSTVILAVWIGVLFGWLGAVALVGGVFVHEFGHVLVINWAGAGPSSIRIIPFFGGAATMRRAPDSDFKSVLIALAGPAFGLLFALPFALAAAVTGNKAWLVGAFYVGTLNLINLAPAAPLDGSKAVGPVLARIHPWVERVVLLLLAGLVLDWALSTHNWLFGGVIALGAVRAFLMANARPSSRPLNLGEWAASLALYVLVVGLCAGVTWWAVKDGGFAPQLLLLGGQK
jgi:Peptidase family M50